MIAASRRSFITGLVALVAAPAIVRAGSLMAVNATLQPAPFMWGFDDERTRAGIAASLRQYVPLVPDAQLDVLYSKMQMRPEWIANAVELFKRSNAMLQEIDREYATDYAFVVGESANVRYERLLPIPDSLALAAAAVAAAPLAKPVTRRFWAK